MEMVQVAVLGVAGTLLAVQFKNEKPEYGIYISLAIGILLLFAVLDRLDVLLNALGLIRSYMRADTIYMGTLMKMLGSPMYPNSHQASVRRRDIKVSHLRLSCLENWRFWRLESRCWRRFLRRLRSSWHERAKILYRSSSAALFGRSIHESGGL